MKRKFVRISGGKLCGKKIYFTGKKTRPTQGKIRKILFNWISDRIEGKNCLDGYSGSGILGFESISRKANSVFFIEKNYSCYKQIKKNLKSISISKNFRIINASFINWIQFSKNKFDLLFLDPPFYKKNIFFILKKLKKKIFNKNSMIYIETEKKNSFFIPNDWILYRKKVSGNVLFCLYFIK
ncbi:16S rRNA (guanine(966)-N(2))-methyltransferase RsmD [bacterium endosymbiont of Pedicinus badii]|uniref:16S rRNA (guanine(966)-N(2))-methyltransferase RsmD n=1 Tax=bacterium endosymbiont of Pedicinus badii TaxID=1719126 RepID=UPI0009B94CBC|nr:16S rRNA (guanine(966)-N(2))-methyltransferase RsmD [bacterium endosymbiont of Pedicinus badii]OQM34080.1 hypothetical protein AOQ89_01860 [bacterium endosymbiont of Pedicinus badii]